MSTKNTRALLHGPKNVKIEESTISQPGKGECQVQIKSTGLCGSDLHYYVHARNGDFVHSEPAVLGHEAGGIITAVGEGVTNLKVGDRVAIEGGIQCGECRLCLEGKYNLCPKMRYFSSAKSNPILHGTLQNFINHPSRLLHPMSDNVSYEQAALIEPLAVSLHAASRVPLTPGASVLIIGAGAMGILQAAVARSTGAGTIAIVDISKERVDFAVGESFATHGYVTPTDKPRPKDSAESLERAKEQAGLLVEKFAGEGGFDVVFECSGVEGCVQMAIYAARPGGKVALIGMGGQNMTLPVSAAANREVDIVGVMRSCNEYPHALSLFSANRLPGLEKLVSVRYPLEKAVDAFETCLRGKDESGKMVMKVMVGDY